ncbi:MAG: hypothetical protein ACOX6I_04545 [Syntrophomonadaceae bacterium]|jgi:hypothetical protein
MKRANKSKMMPDASVLEGVPSRNPHEEFKRRDALFKKRRGAQE